MIKIAALTIIIGAVCIGLAIEFFTDPLRSRVVPKRGRKPLAIYRAMRYIGRKPLGYGPE